MTLSSLAMLCRRHHRVVHEEGYQPWASDRRPLPRWLVPAVMAAWSQEGPRSRQWALSVALEIRGPRVLAHELRRRWRNPIEATVEVGGPFNALPRLPWQLAAYFGRAVCLVRD